MQLPAHTYRYLTLRRISRKSDDGTGSRTWPADCEPDNAGHISAVWDVASMLMLALHPAARTAVYRGTTCQLDKPIGTRLCLASRYTALIAVECNASLSIDTGRIRYGYGVRYGYGTNTVYGDGQPVQADRRANLVSATLPSAALPLCLHPPPPKICCTAARDPVCKRAAWADPCCPGRRTRPVILAYTYIYYYDDAQRRQQLATL